MGQFDNEIFGFGNETNEEFEQASNFNYNSISGLGESNYENEDLFSTEVSYDNTEENSQNFRIGNFDNNQGYGPFDNFIGSSEEVKGEELFNLETPISPVFMGEPVVENVNEQVSGEPFASEKSMEEVESIQEEPQISIPETVIETPVSPVFMDEPVEENIVEKTTLEPTVVAPTTMEEQNKVTISETPIEELNKLTEYEEDKIEETNIGDLFDKVSVNVSEASDIFRKNTDLKKKIDVRFEELKKLQAEIEGSRKKQIDEVNSYKEEVLQKLTDKKEEIEKRLNLLKESQATLEKEKQEFEKYKKEEQEKIEKIQKEVQSAYDDRREELGHIEDVLRKQKDSLDNERSQLSLDRIQYESDKNELANNLLKFNELVSTFKNGVNDIKE